MTINKKKATDQQIIEKYKELNNIWLVGKALGMAGQSVQERLVKLGIKRNNPRISQHELDIIRDVYSKSEKRGDIDLKSLSLQINRTPQFICRKAKKMGLTTYRRKINEKLNTETSERKTKWYKENEHPKGMLGKTHTEETKMIISTKMMKTKLEKYGTLSQNKPHGSWKAEWREIGGKRKYFRSRWEANYARVLECMKQRGMIKDWFHEPETFWFEEIKRGCRSYLPDFKVIKNDDSIYYVEVKGWMDDRSMTKIKRMKKYHPEVKLVVIQKKEYEELKKTYGWFIKDWE